MHIIAILLFPVRLVTTPLLIPITGIMYGLTSDTANSGNTSYLQLLGQVTKAWLLWNAGN